MFYTLRLKKLKIIGAAVLALLIALLLPPFKDKGKAQVFVESSVPCLVIDPGHGGIDGGAIAVNGAKESDINLEIALKLSTLADLYGINTVLTRSDDTARTDALSYSEREELEHRTDIINSVSNAVLISIHQNCYPTAQPWGAQVLYSASGGSEGFGLLTHKNIIDNLEPDNRRVAEPAPKELYITSHVKCPAILVECGFVSNFSDAEKLTDDKYQTQLSAVLLASYLQFTAGAG